MKILDFEKSLENASNVLDYRFIDSVIKASLNPVSGEQIGEYNLIIVMEEAAELIETVIDFDYLSNDSIYLLEEHLLEEIADNLLSIRYVQIIAGISGKQVASICETLQEDSITDQLYKTLAKWQQSVSKYIRKRAHIHKDGLTHDFMEKLANNAAYLQVYLYAYADIMEISKERINKAINVKINRQSERNKK